LRAWRLSQADWKQKDIAPVLGVTEGAVSQWIKKARAAGADALRHHPPAGPQPKLTEEQRAQVPDLLAKGAEPSGLRGAIWTTARVAVVIKQPFAVSSHPAHGSRLLPSIKDRVQKPEEGAIQRHEEAMATWKRERWQELKQSAAGQAADCLWRRIGLFSVATGGADFCPYG
jgi:putative transposase